MQRPLVSIGIPTFNHAEVIADALRSAMLQDYENLEIVILDNASVDTTEDVVSAVSQGDARVRYLRNETNLGMAGNFNACIASARGDFIKFLCADDLLEPSCVTEMVNAFEQNPEATLVASARLLVDEELAPLGVSRFSRRARWVDAAAAIRNCFFRGNLIGEPTAVMFRREDALRGFRDDYRQLMDLEMWMYLLQSGGMVYIDHPLCRVRRHPHQATQKHLKSGVVLDNKRRLFREFGDALPEATVAEKFFWDIRMAITLFRTGEAGLGSGQAGIEEIYYRHLFPRVTRPFARLIWSIFGDAS